MKSKLKILKPILFIGRLYYLFPCLQCRLWLLLRRVVYP